MGVEERADLHCVALQFPHRLLFEEEKRTAQLGFHKRARGKGR